MEKIPENIHPVFDQLQSRASKEALLKQRAKSLWMTGLSGSGKTTVARYAEQLFQDRGYLVAVLDGDNVRSGLNNNLGFSEADRTENIRRIAEVNKLMLHCGVVVINCFVSPTREIRAMARDIIGDTDFVEVFVDTPLELCEQRDVKGLYAKVRKGEIKDFTGIDAPFETPLSPDVRIQTAGQTPLQSAQELVNETIKKIVWKS